MSKLTNKEKAERYDALQVAIEFQLETCKRREKEARENYNKSALYDGIDIIAAYNKGLAIAFDETIKILTAFIN